MAPQLPHKSGKNGCQPPTEVVHFDPPTKAAVDQNTLCTLKLAPDLSCWHSASFASTRLLRIDVPTSHPHE